LQQTSLAKALAIRKKREYELQAALHGVKLKSSMPSQGIPPTGANVDAQLRAGMAKGLPIKFGKRGQSSRLRNK